MVFNFELNKYGLRSDVELTQCQISALRADIFNGIPGNLPGIHCSDCLNKGVVAIVTDGCGVRLQKCKCALARNFYAQMEEAGVDSAFAMNFMNFKEESNWHAWVKRKAVRFADKPDGWLLICGPKRSGKSHLGIAICRRRIWLEEEAHYSRWEDDMALVRVLPVGSKQREHLIEVLKTVPVLFWDDIFRFERSNSKRRIGTSEIDVTAEIIYYRHFNRLTTLLATDRKPADLFAVEEDIVGTILENAEKNIIQLQSRLIKDKA